MVGGTLVFDLETQRLAHEVGGWAFVDRMGLAAAVTLHVETDKIERFLEADATALIEQLKGADQVIGYNLLRFDYHVLRPYGLDPAHLDLDRTIDLLDHLHRTLGFHVSLDNVAAATLGEAKIADGLTAVTWYRQGLIDKVLDYCEEDVRLTRRLWEHGRAKGQVQFRDRNFRLQNVPVQW